MCAFSSSEPPFSALIRWGLSTRIWGRKYNHPSNFALWVHPLLVLSRLGKLRHRRTTDGTRGNLMNCACASRSATRNPGPPSVYHYSSTRRDWPVKKPLSVCLSRWREIHFCQFVDIGAAWQTLLTWVRLRLRLRAALSPSLPRLVFLAWVDFHARSRGHGQKKVRDREIPYD